MSCLRHALYISATLLNACNCLTNYFRKKIMHQSLKQNFDHFLHNMIILQSEQRQPPATIAGFITRMNNLKKAFYYLHLNLNLSFIKLTKQVKFI